MSWKMLLNHWILYFPSPNSYEDYRIGLVIHSLPNLFRSFTWPDDIKYWRKASQLLCSWVTELAFSVNNSTYLKDILPFWEYTEPIWNHSEHSEIPFYSKQITGRELIFGSTVFIYISTYLHTTGSSAYNVWQYTWSPFIIFLFFFLTVPNI